jgi:hypothetical protein
VGSAREEEITALSVITGGGVGTISDYEKKVDIASEAALTPCIVRSPQNLQIFRVTFRLK